jgi:lipopolysaccharide biosynthesis protein
VGVADTWHVDRLLNGNTIDAMAMIRRAALIRAGGYSVLADDHGWEDYDLWCRFFTLGMRGVFLPELLCEYRRHDRSMTDTRTRKNLDSLQAEMALRYPEIFNREARILTVDQDLSISLPLDYKFERTSKAPTVAIVIHMFYPDLTDESLGYVENIPFPADVLISTDTLQKKAYIEERLERIKNRGEVRVTAPQGLDIGLRLIGFRDIMTYRSASKLAWPLSPKSSRFSKGG